MGLSNTPRDNGGAVTAGSGQACQPSKHKGLAPFWQAMRFSRTFLLNLAAATFGPILFEPSYKLYRLSESTTWPKVVLVDLINGVLAFGMGYYFYQRFRTESSKWVWIVGLWWWSTRFTEVLDGQHGTIWEFSSRMSNTDVSSAITWATFTIPFLRTAFYSAGAIYRSARESR